MPTILRIGALRVVVYPNDHPPAHVHVLGPGWVVVVNLVALTVREAINCSNARAVLALVRERQTQLLEAWRRIHG